MEFRATLPPFTNDLLLFLNDCLSRRKKKYEQTLYHQLQTASVDWTDDADYTLIFLFFSVLFFRTLRSLVLRR